MPCNPGLWRSRFSPEHHVLGVPSPVGGAYASISNRVGGRRSIDKLPAVLCPSGHGPIDPLRVVIHCANAIAPLGCHPLSMPEPLPLVSPLHRTRSKKAGKSQRCAQPRAWFCPASSHVTHSADSNRDIDSGHTRITPSSLQRALQVGSLGSRSTARTARTGSGPRSRCWYLSTWPKPSRS